MNAMSDVEVPNDRPTNWKAIAMIAVCTAVIAFIVASLEKGSDGSIGKALPEFRPAGWIDDKALTAEQMQDKVLVVDAWASWCGPCIAETKHLVDVYGKFGENPRLQFVGITMEQEDALPNMKMFIERLHVPWPNAYGAEAFFQELGINTIPRVYVVNSKGEIIWSNTVGGDIEDAIQRALAM